MKKNTENLVVVEETKILTMEDLAALQANAGESIYQTIGYQAGTVSVPITALEQVETDDVVMRLLHIDAVNITHATVDGIESDFPAMSFAEMPGKFYQGGGRITDIIYSWAEAAGDEFDLVENPNQRPGKRAKPTMLFHGNRLLPALNDFIKNNGFPSVVFKWKDGKDNKYVDCIVLGV